MTLAVRPAQASLLAALRRAGQPRFVVIGATALHHHVPLRRQTADVDLAVVADPAEIAAVLRSQRGWTPDSAHADRWQNGDERLDVVPATSALVEAGVVRFERNGKELSLVGFDLALAHTVLVPVLDVEVEVAELPALVVLKMIAWLDRPHERRKDLGDLAHVLDRALPDFDERRWEPPLVDVDVDVEDQSAFFVGRSVRTIARTAHVGHVHDFLTKIAVGSWPAILGTEGNYAAEDVEAMAKRRLGAFSRGFS
jgi:predicted nucleotidyltransferase